MTICSISVGTEVDFCVSPYALERGNYAVERSCKCRSLRGAVGDEAISPNMSALLQRDCFRLRKSCAGQVVAYGSSQRLLFNPLTSTF